MLSVRHFVISFLFVLCISNEEISHLESNPVLMEMTATTEAIDHVVIEYHFTTPLLIRSISILYRTTESEYQTREIPVHGKSSFTLSELEPTTVYIICPSIVLTNGTVLEDLDWCISARTLSLMGMDEPTVVSEKKSGHGAPNINPLVALILFGICLIIVFIVAICRRSYKAVKHSQIKKTIHTHLSHITSSFFHTKPVTADDFTKESSQGQPRKVAFSAAGGLDMVVEVSETSKSPPGTIEKKPTFFVHEEALSDASSPRQTPDHAVVHPEAIVVGKIISGDMGAGTTPFQLQSSATFAQDLKEAENPTVVATPPSVRSSTPSEPEQKGSSDSSSTGSGRAHSSRISSSSGSLHVLQRPMFDIHHDDEATSDSHSHRSPRTGSDESGMSDSGVEHLLASKPWHRFDDAVCTAEPSMQQGQGMTWNPSSHGFEGSERGSEEKPGKSGHNSPSHE